MAENRFGALKTHSLRGCKDVPGEASAGWGPRLCFLRGGLWAAASATPGVEGPWELTWAPGGSQFWTGALGLTSTQDRSHIQPLGGGRSC